MFLEDEIHNIKNKPDSRGLTPMLITVDHRKGTLLLQGKAAQTL